MATITDAARTGLHNKVRDVLGEQEGDTLMAHLPPVGWADVATKSDVAHLAERIDLLSERIDLLSERIEQCPTNAAVERGFRRQSMWIVSIFVAQQASFVYMIDRLAG